MLLDRAPAVANWVRLYDETLARLTIRAGREGLTLAEALNRLSDADAARGASPPPRASPRRWKPSAARWRSPSTPWPSRSRWKTAGKSLPDARRHRHVANEVDAEAVAALEAAVVASYPRLSHRYYG